MVVAALEVPEAICSEIKIGGENGWCAADVSHLFHFYDWLQQTLNQHCTQPHRQQQPLEQPRGASQALVQAQIRCGC